MSEEEPIVKCVGCDSTEYIEDEMSRCEKCNRSFCPSCESAEWFKSSDGDAFCLDCYPYRVTADWECGGEPKAGAALHLAGCRMLKFCGNSFADYDFCFIGKEEGEHRLQGKRYKLCKVCKAGGGDE